MELYGILRISNPDTLQRWIDNGTYLRLLRDGWIFNPSCGRFTTSICRCHECRNDHKGKGERLRRVLLMNNIPVHK